MKKILLVLFITVGLFGFTNVSAQENAIVGKWKGTDQTQNVGYMIFDKEGYVSMEISGQLIGGKEFILNDSKGSMQYKTNFNVKPATLDMVLTNLNTKEEKRMLGIIEIINPNEIKIAFNFDEERPTTFQQENTLLLNRE